MQKGGSSSTAVGRDKCIYTHLLTALIHLSGVVLVVWCSSFLIVSSTISPLDSQCSRCFFSIVLSLSDLPLRPPNDIFDIFLTFSGGPTSTPPGPHLTFCFDCIRHFPGTLPNRYFDIFSTFSGKSGKKTVTLGSSGYGDKP